jgi:chemotaxis protein CheX
MTASSKANIDLLTEWRGILGLSAAEVFSMMVGVEVNPVEQSAAPALPSVTGAVGIAGAITAVFSLRCSTQTASKIAARMLGIPAEEAAKQQCDAIGEICNIVAGQFKAKVGLEDKCMLSVPTVITGGDYRIRSSAACVRLELPVLCEGDSILLALEIHK